MEQGEHGEYLRRQMREAIAQATTSPAMRNRKLMFWGVRQILLCVLAWYYWDMTWMRWVFWIGVGVALLNLTMILVRPRFIVGQQRRGHDTLDRLDALGREGRDDPQEGWQD